MKAATKQRVRHRLSRVEGQVRALRTMVERDAYCIDVITLSSAARHALSAIEDAMLENHLDTHVVAQMKSGKHKKATREIVAVYKIAKRK